LSSYLPDSEIFAIAPGPLLGISHCLSILFGSSRSKTTQCTVRPIFLENLVHRNSPVSFIDVAIPIDFEDAIGESFDCVDLSNYGPALPSTQWSAAMALSSMIIQTERN
jgi:hypothetical protein